MWTNEHSAYSESDRRAGASPRPPRSRGPQIHKMSTYFWPFSTVFRQNGAQNYFHFRFPLQLQIHRVRLYQKRHTYRYRRILANFLDAGTKVKLWAVLLFFAKMAANSFSRHFFRFRFSLQIRTPRPRLY